MHVILQSSLLVQQMLRAACIPFRPETNVSRGMVTRKDDGQGESKGIVNYWIDWPASSQDASTKGKD